MIKTIAAVLMITTLSLPTGAPIIKSIPITHEAVALEVNRLPSVTKTDPLFEKIGDCESQHNLKAKNPNSSASGEYQWLAGSWKYYGKKLWGDDWMNKDIFGPENRELAWYVYTHYGTGDWEADQKSYNCWKGEIPNAVYLRSAVSR